MRDILGTGARSLLKELADDKAMLAFDFDGTLVSIAHKRSDAGLRAGTRRRLQALCRLYPCVVISGRARVDLRSQLRGIELEAVVGNQGFEAPRGEARFRQQVRRWLPTLRSTVGSLEGVELEDKRYTVTLHYRHASLPRRAVKEISRVAKQLEGARLVWGRRAANLLPAQGIHNKGTALERLRHSTASRSALYVGDDDTDEDAFALRHVVSVRVGRHADSHARYFIKGQSHIDQLLDRLIDLRAST